jgi:predicted porin
MMKHPIAQLAAAALAAAGWSAQAQTSQVTVFGLIDLSIGQTKAPGGVRNRDVDSGKMTTSHFGLRGSEDLGGGLSALFRLEHFLRADTGEAGRFTGDTFWSRNATAGLSHKDYGTVTLGRNTTPLFIATVNFNPFGDSFGLSPAVRHYFTSGTATGDSGWNDSIVYSSQNLGGLRFGLAATTDTNGSGGRNVGANVGYAAGPLAAAFVYQNVEKDGSTAVQDTRTWQLSGSYALSAAKLFVQVGKVDNKTTGNSFDIVGFGASVPLGAGSVLAYYSRIKPDTGNQRKTFSVGYDHFLSKRTDLYAVAMSDKIATLSSGHGYSFGIRHRF